MPQVIHHHLTILTFHIAHIGVGSLKVHARGRKVVAMKAAQPRGSGGILPQKSFKFRVSARPFPAFFCRTFSVN